MKTICPRCEQEVEVFANSKQQLVIAYHEEEETDETCRGWGLHISHAKLIEDKTP